MKNKKAAIFILILLLISMLYVGLNIKYTAQEYAQIFWNVKVDPSEDKLKKLKLSKKERQELTKELKENEKEDLKCIILDLGIEANDSQISNIYDAYVNAVLKNDVIFEQIYAGEENSKIKISTTYFNLTDIIVEAQYESYKELKSLKLKDDNKIKEKYAELFTKLMVDGLNSVQISSDKNEKIFSFVLNSNEEWIPEDTKDFIQSIGEMSVQ